MPIAARTAETTWDVSLAAGHGTARAASGAFAELEVTEGPRVCRTPS